jgi:hypothetical protein
MLEAPDAVEKVPPTQAVQEDWPDALEKEPEPHDTHTPDDCTPSPVEKVPDAHPTHRPNPLEYLPVEQRWQTALFVSTPMPGIMQRQAVRKIGLKKAALRPMPSVVTALPVPANTVSTKPGKVIIFSLCPLSCGDRKTSCSPNQSTSSR